MKRLSSKGLPASFRKYIRDGAVIVVAQGTLGAETFTTRASLPDELVKTGQRGTSGVRLTLLRSDAFPEGLAPLPEPHVEPDPLQKMKAANDATDAKTKAAEEELARERVILERQEDGSYRAIALDKMPPDEKMRLADRLGLSRRRR